MKGTFISLLPFLHLWRNLVLEVVLMYCGLIGQARVPLNKQPSPMELIKLAESPRVMQTAKKFHQSCANAGLHITKEVRSFQPP